VLDITVILYQQLSFWMP